VIPFIASLEWIHYSNMAILNLMLSKKVPKGLEGFSETRVAFQGLTTPSRKKEFRIGKGRRNRPRDTEGMLLRSMKSNNKKVLSPSLGLMV